MICSFFVCMAAEALIHNKHIGLFVMYQIQRCFTGKIVRSRFCQYLQNVCRMLNKMITIFFYVLWNEIFQEVAVCCIMILLTHTFWLGEDTQNILLVMRRTNFFKIWNGACYSRFYLHWCPVNHLFLSLLILILFMIKCRPTWNVGHNAGSKLRYRRETVRCCLGRCFMYWLLSTLLTLDFTQ